MLLMLGQEFTSTLKQTPISEEALAYYKALCGNIGNTINIEEGCDIVLPEGSKLMLVNVEINNDNVAGCLHVDMTYKVVVDQEVITRNVFSD